MEAKNYWGTRAWAPRSSERLQRAVRRVKHSRRFAHIFAIAASLRVQNELFIAHVLEQHRCKTVLDLACGPGQDVIGSREYAIGVDLPGSPRDAALARGYKSYVFYKDDRTFEIDRAVDAIVCMNLNAHVPFELFSQIVRNGLRYLKPGGIVMFVNEYDNDGLTYWAMKKLSRLRWQKMVSRMDHGYLEYESSFIDKLRTIGIENQIDRRALTAGILPFAHYLWFSGLFGTSRLKRAVAVAMDVPLSLINSIQARFFGRENRAFLVGHAFKIP